MNLRWRLTLFYLALSTFITVLAGVALFTELRQSLQASLDGSLREAAELAASQLRDELRGTFTEAETDVLLERLVGGTVLLIEDGQGNILDQVGTAKVTAPLVEGFSTVGDQRVYSLELDTEHWVQTMRSQVEILQAVGRAQRLLFGGLPFLLLIGLGVGYFLADSALKPVDDVTRLASRIAASGHFHERLPETKSDPEMARLTRTFNEMLARLETSLEREKAFALAAAHELRTPLSFIRGRSSLSLEKPRAPEHYQKSLTQIHGTSQQMSAMVETLLAIARTHQSPQRETLNLADLLKEVAESYRNEADERSVRLELHLYEAEVLGDRTALHLVVQNLLRNAIKYGREGGHVYLSSGARNQEVFVGVCDDGAGIPEADLERIKQPFQRGAAMQGVSGSGLGLALASVVAEQHGGRLELGRAGAGGLRAELWLPKA